VRQGIERVQLATLGIEVQFRNGAIPNPKVQFDCGLGRYSKDVTNRRRNRTATRDDEYITAKIVPDVIKRARNTAHKILISRHSSGLGLALHPLRQAVS